MPEGMVRSSTRGEYTWAKTGETMVYVPFGPSVDFVMGATNGIPTTSVQEVNVQAFYIGKYEVTVSAYRKFVQATGYKTEAERIGKVTVWDPKKLQMVETSGINWTSPGFPQSDQHPVVLVTWEDAKAYCDWAGGILPTRLEWFKAAVWDDLMQMPRVLPWLKPLKPGDPVPIPTPFKFGDPIPPDPNAKNGNFLDASFYKFNGLNVPPGLVDDGYAFTAPVGTYPQGASYYGAQDMAGNVSEWTGDQVTPSMQEAWFATFNQQMPTGYFALGTHWGSFAWFPLIWPVRYPPNLGGWREIGLRIVIAAPLTATIVK